MVAYLERQEKGENLEWMVYLGRAVQTDSQDLQEFKVQWVSQENPECQASKESWVLRGRLGFPGCGVIRGLLGCRESRGCLATKVYLVLTEQRESQAPREKEATSDCPETQD